jgi:hypothetical protein
MSDVPAEFFEQFFALDRSPLVQRAKCGMLRVQTDARV